MKRKTRKHLLNSFVGTFKGYDPTILNKWWNGHTWNQVEPQKKVRKEA